MSDSRHPDARELVLTHGWNATSYQILNPGIAHWFSSRGDAVVGYADHAGVRVVAGAPVASADRLADVVSEFEASAAADGMSVCYFCAEDRLGRLLGPRPSHALVLLGAQPSWDPAGWAERIAARRSVRAQLARARRKGVGVTEEAPQDAQRDAGIADCLTRWLATRGLPPLHFLVEPETLRDLRDRRIFVARRSGRTVGFLVASPIAARRGWLIEQFVRSPDAPNGTVELMIDAALTTLARDGARYVSLGLAPLARPSDAPPGSQPPAWLRLLLGWMRAHGRRFFDFRGLEEFKAKFSPAAWEPVVAIFNGPAVTPRPVYAIAAAFTGGRPVRTFASGLARAAGRELGIGSASGRRADRGSGR